MRSKIPALLLLLFVLTNLLYSCSAPKALEYRSFKNVTTEKLSFSASTLKMDLVYYNPNNFGMQLTSTDLDVFINNMYLGKTSQQYQVTVPKREEFLLPIKIDVDMKNLLKNGLTTLLTSEVRVKLTGTITVGKLNVFKTFRVNYEGTHRLELF
jgi:LEA14-like dessication related protein